MDTYYVTFEHLLSIKFSSSPLDKKVKRKKESKANANFKYNINLKNKSRKLKISFKKDVYSKHDWLYG